MTHRCFARAVAAVALVLLLPAWVHGHALLHEVLEGEAVVLRFAFPGGEQPWFEPYEVFAPGAQTPFQSGRINAQGEVSFRPDRPGLWRVRVFTEDGHGAVIELEVDQAGRVDAIRSHHAGMHGYWRRVFAALGYLLGGFGLLALWRFRRSRAGRG